MESTDPLIPRPRNTYITRIKSFILEYYFILGSICYIFLDVFITIFAKRLVDSSANYTFFLNQFNTLFFVIFYFIGYMFFIIFLPSYVQTKLSFYKLFRLCVLDSISGVFYNIGVVFTSGTRLVMLSQISVPMTIISSKIITNRKYHKLQYIGTSIITISVIITQLIFSNTTSGNKLFFNLILMTSFVIDSISICYREEQYSIQAMNIPGYQFWFTFMLFLLNFITVVLYSFKFWGSARMDLRNYFTSLSSGFNCIFRGINTITEDCGGPDQRKCDDCVSAPNTALVFLLLAISIRLVFILLMRNRSALVMILISIIKTPIVSVAFSMKALAENSRSSLQIKDILTLIFILIGMSIYTIGTKKQQEVDQNRSEIQSQTIGLTSEYVSI